MTRNLYRLLFIAACYLGLAYQVNAQSVYTTTWVGSVNYQNGNQMVGAATSTMSYSTQVYYCMDVWAYLHRDGVEINSNFASNNCDETVSLTQVEVSTPDNLPNAEYVIEGAFAVTPYYTGSEGDYYNYQSYLDPPYIFDYISSGFLGPGPARPNVGSILLGIVYNFLQQGNPPGNCGDVRDTIRREYVTHRANLRPACADFTQNRHSDIFTFNQLNTGNFAWALIRYPLIADHNNNLFGLDEWVVQYGVPTANITINSAYRSPARNAAVGGAQWSRHMHGDAADIRNVSRTKNEYDSLSEAARTANADYIEPWTGPGRDGCVHADWRDHAGGYN